MSQSAFATHIGISRVMQSRILHGYAARAADMDLRLAEAQGTSSGFWLRLQVQRDLWEAAQRTSLRPSIPLQSTRPSAGSAASCRRPGAPSSTHNPASFVMPHRHGRKKCPRR